MKTYEVKWQNNTQEGDFLMQQKRGRGGARKGAGRKPSGSEPTVQVSIRLMPSTKEKLREVVKNRKITIGAFIESAIQQALSENK